MVRLLSAAAVTIALVTTAAAMACGRSGRAASAPAIELTIPPGGGAAYIEVTGLSDEALGTLRGPDLTGIQWSDVLRVAVADDAAGMLGGYGVVDGALRFTPQYSLDPGREYYVRFDPARLPGAAGPRGPAIVARVGPPALDTTPSTVVAHVYPTGDEVPENLLRMYVEFSAPMGRQSGIGYMTLLDEDGREIPGAFLPLDYEFWSPDHRRFTAFFDPGRVKDGILPNQQMGRALEAGRSATLVIGREWRDEHGLPLEEEFRRVLRVGPAQVAPLDPASWRLQAPPSAGRHDGVIVTFPAPLDHGLLMRALGVTRDGAPVPGEVVVDAAETRWTFTPDEPWRAGPYELLALDILEDVAGNQIGRAFEVDQFETVDRSPDPKRLTIPFQVGAAGTR